MVVYPCIDGSALYVGLQLFHSCTFLLDRHGEQRVVQLLRKVFRAFPGMEEHRGRQLDACAR